MKSKQYKFLQSIWKSSGKGAWYFVTIPNSISEEIRANFSEQEQGWGRLKAKAKINQTQWNTSVWFDTKLSSYILPIKSDIRRKESLTEGSEVNVELFFDRETLFD